MAFGRSTNILALFNSNTLNLVMLWWLMKGCWVSGLDSASVMLLFGLQNLCV